MRSARLRAPAAAASALGLLLSASCGHDPVDPGPDLEVAVAGGDGQYGNVGQSLPAALDAVVRRIDTGAHQKDIEVEWTVASGDATLSTSRVSTDADGHVRVSVRLGANADTVRVRATVAIQPAASTTFTVYAALAPHLEALSSAEARAGDTITITGVGFSPTPTQDVVLFSGIRGRVVSATDRSLRVEVPPCLPSRTVAVTSQLGALVSAALPLAVTDAGRATALEPGEYVDVDESVDLGCVRLQGGGARYLVSALSTSTVGAARYPYVLQGISAEGSSPTPSPSPAMPRPAPGRGGGDGGTASFPARWEAALRGRESALVRDAGGAFRPARAPTAPVPPTVGERRTFKVLNASSGFDDVSAVARVVGKQAAIYVDDKAPKGGYTDADLQAFSDAFDQYIQPTDTKAFGSPSDLDGNQRIVILFTPTVNALTPRGSSGFVGGFFYGLDLLDRDNSNHAEIFYAIVPDSTGIFGDSRKKAKVLESVPAILAHEFQHMISFNERVLKLGADGAEALWLSEGMAQMAEELVADAYARAGRDSVAQLYRSGDEDRARRYLADPSAVSTIVATGQGSLEERGGGWLFTLYLRDHDPAGDILLRLTRSTRSGIQNVAFATGRPWPELFSDWAAALFLDGLGVGSSRLTYPGVDLRARLSPPSGVYPLVPDTLPGGDFQRSASLWSSSVKHYIVVPSASGSVVLRLGGDTGANPPADAGLRLRVVRLR